MTSSLLEPVRAALGTVNDPEIRRPITELGMVSDIDIAPDGTASVTVLLTVSGCPMKETLTRDVTAAVSSVAGVTSVSVTLGVMSAEQRSSLQQTLRGGQPAKEIQFARSDSLTQVLAIASGKGGVGKSSVTVNLALAMASAGRKVGILDADVYGHSVPAMLGIADERPTQVEDMIMPVPTMGLSVISIGMLKPRRDQVVAWRGPMLDRALVQMLTDVYWGDLDVLLLDLPPGTGDMAISSGQHLPNSEVIVVTTPQAAAAEVAERAGTMASMMQQRVAGVIENMSYLVCPHCGPEHRIDVFGTGGGETVAKTLTARLGYDVPVLGHVPLDLRLRAGGDTGRPLVLAAPDTPAAVALIAVAEKLMSKGRGLAGLQLGLSPAGR
ncbi:MAG: Mrp/NBP35 family ATP-binding protein [Nocardioidaceae bacterium]|nr:Mrp/NBP35 family ATP-binding protein [Nocardioidaceae bacterium]